MAIKLRPLSYPLGAEVCDIDVAAPISESDFGELDNHDAFPSDRQPDYHELMVVTNDPQPEFVYGHN